MYKVIDVAAVRQPSVQERFWSKAETTPKGCWEWQGNRSRLGYGRFHLNGESWMAHRIAYAIHVAEVPPHLTLDHLCRNRACVNPAHLEPTPQRVNVWRGVGPTADNHRKVTCPEGHTYNVRYNGHRRCRECRRKGEAGRPR